MNTKIENNEVEDRRQLLHTITQETRFKLIQTVLAHPKQLPTLKEISYANPSKSTSTIRGHLEKLIEIGVLEKVWLPEDQQQRDLPRKFYGLTDSGRQLLAKHGLLEGEEVVRGFYKKMDKTEKIQQYENAPRPNDPDDDGRDSSDRDSYRNPELIH